MPGHSIAADAGDATRPSSQRKTRARRAVYGIDSFRDETVRRRSRDAASHSCAFTAAFLGDFELLSALADAKSSPSLLPRARASVDTVGSTAGTALGTAIGTAAVATGEGAGAAGAVGTGAAEVLAHPFIAAHVDVDAVRARTAEAPLVPSLDAVNAGTIAEVGDMEKPKLKLDQAHFRAFAGWEFRDERLMQLELIDAIESEGVDPTPPAKDDGCISCCVTQ